MKRTETAGVALTSPDVAPTTTSTTVTAGPRVTHLSAPHEVRLDMEQDVLAGLTGRDKVLPPKYFYDGVGSDLFEAITRLPEYYPTRAETEILEREAAGIIAAVSPEEILELGSGSSRKTRVLLEAMHDHGSGSRYVPVDVSEGALLGAARAMQADYAWLEVDGYVADFSTDLHRLPHGPRRIAAFLGSTIGNLEPVGRRALYREVATLLGPDDAFLLGTDLRKDPAVLVAAYDDAQGVTAEFNLNMLDVLNRGLGADFDRRGFGHVAIYDEHYHRIEMRLRSKLDQIVTFPTLDLRVPFAAGEELRTEISCKFDRATVAAELADAGLVMERWMTDSQGRFALSLSRPTVG